MTLPGDYHVHTTFSDGTGSVADCIAQAVRLGLPEVGIADHVSPEPDPVDPVFVSPEQLDIYVATVREAAAEAVGITVLLGVEAEYVAGCEGRLGAIVGERHFDYVIGGIHVVDGFEFDDPAQRDDERWKNVDQLFLDYYRTVRHAGLSGLFDVIAHFDYIGLWGHVPGPRVQAAIEAALDAIATSGAALELNTDRLGDPAGVMYPSDEILHAASARGIPLVIDSDAHEPEHVGRLWDEAIERAARAGYRETLRLSDRSLVPLPGLA
jgi:histidinol-phosphatase (PHP family)